MTPIRNIAIIAHVDHGKTTLVDRLIHAGNVFQAHQTVGELIMDSGDLERERGITITAKNLSIRYKDTKINILDTPGHADFGGEVERVLRMADGVILLVDAFEGPMPQTRFVTSKAIAMGLRFIVLVNKVDKPNCDPDGTLDKVFDLLVALDASEEQLDFPVMYGSGKQGWFGPDWKTPTGTVEPLLDQVLHSFEPFTRRDDEPLQLQITTLDYNSFQGRIAIGRVVRGSVSENQSVLLMKRDGSQQRHRIKEVFAFEGLNRVKVPQGECGDIVALVGLEGFEIGDTVCHPDHPEALPHIVLEEPTLSMFFTVNNSPFFGKEGKFVTSRHLRDRLLKETEKNLALRVEETASADSFLVYGRGVLHLAVLIETMRREGYELQLGQPRVVFKEVNGERWEPIEMLVVDTPPESAGAVIELVSVRKGEMLVMEPKGDFQHLEFNIPARGLIGLRTQLLTATRGEAIMAHRFLEYQPYKGPIPGRINGTIISQGTGTAIAYAMWKLSERMTFIIPPGVDVYMGQIVGLNSRPEDMVVNLQKAKQLTNIRTTSADEAITLPPHQDWSLEQYLEFLEADEYLEVTPQSIRLRKILLDEVDRKRAGKQAVAY